METGNLIIGVLSAIVVASPFVYNYIRNKQKVKALTSKLSDFASKSYYSLDDSEVDNGHIFGIDKTNKIAFYGYQNEGNVHSFKVYLDGVTSCRIIRESVGSPESDKGAVSDYIEVLFSSKDKKIGNQSFMMPIEASRGIAGGEYIFCKKWVEKFKELI